MQGLVGLANDTGVRGPVLNELALELPSPSTLVTGSSFPIIKTVRHKAEGKAESGRLFVAID